MNKQLSYIFAVVLLLVSCCGKSSHDSYYDIADNGEWLRIKDSIRCNKEGKYFFKVYELDSLNTVQYLCEGDMGVIINVPTFKICKGTMYAKDWKRVYYGMGCVGMTLRMNELGNRNEIKFVTLGWVIPGCSPHTFKYLGNGYAIDHKSMFLNGNEIPWNDDIIKELLTNKK